MERELEELEQEELDNELLDIPSAINLPSVPVTEPTGAAKVPAQAAPTRPSSIISTLR